MRTSTMPERKPSAMPRNWLMPKRAPPLSSRVRVAELISTSDVPSCCGRRGIESLSPWACMAALSCKNVADLLAVLCLGCESHGRVEAGQGLALDLAQGQHVPALPQDLPHQL